MPSNLLEITAIFKGERLRFENTDNITIIGDVELIGSETKNGTNLGAIKGQVDEDGLIPNQTYRFYGKWQKYKNPRGGGEMQFVFKTFVEAQPHGRAGIVGYLKRAGEGNNIGHATANQIYEKFGSDCVRILREQPEVIAAGIKRLTEAHCIAASEWLTERKALEDCSIELTNLLDGRGFPKDTARKAVKIWGNKAGEVINKNPYQLIELPGCGFKRCDALYLDLGLDPARLRRQSYCVWHSIASNNDGHTWFTAAQAVQGLRGSIGGAEIRPRTALRMAKRIGLLSLDAAGAIVVLRETGGAVCDGGENVWIAEGRKGSNEIELAELIHRQQMKLHGSIWPDVDDIENIDDHQREKLSNALDGSVAILGGGPGTGKTFVAANLIKSIAEDIGYDDIAVVAPTGKAAVRISEAMEANQVPLRARTLHSLLGIGVGTGFAHNAFNPLELRLILVDETSMVDTNMMFALFDACPVGCHVLLIGDINQLPPVGHGAPLRDMISAGVSYGELTEIKRNSGGIVEACAAIREGRKWEAGDNLKIRKANSTQGDSMLYTLTEANLDGFDPIWDCQVLTAVNEKSPLSRKVLNEILQEELNGESPGHKNSKYKVGDKVVNLKNGYFTLAEDSPDDFEEIDENDKGEVYVANGELARVVEVAEKYFVAEVQSPKRVVRVPAGGNWDLGYALSVHKSQGSEWPVVIVMIDDYPGARMVCDRSWLYTAISRAKDKCFLIGKKSTADSMCRRNKIDGRKTFLKEHIIKTRVEMELMKI